MIAEFLRDWLPTVLSGAVEPFVSSQDIAKGDRGLTVIARELDEINYGVVILTRDNREAPWINFEAGALAKIVGEGRVSTVLVGVTPTDITGPLSQFQHTILSDRVDTRQLLGDMARESAAIDGKSVPTASLDALFEMKWPALEAEVASASDGGAPVTERDQKDILEEVLEVVRGIQREVGRRSEPVHLLPTGLGLSKYWDTYQHARQGPPSIAERLSATHDLLSKGITPKQSALLSWLAAAEPELTPQQLSMLLLSSAIEERERQSSDAARSTEGPTEDGERPNPHGTDDEKDETPGVD